MSKKRNRNRSARRSNERSGVSRTLLEVALDLLELNREDMRVMDLSPAAREALDLDPVRFRRRTDATIRLQDRYQAVLEKDGVEVRDATRLAWAVQSLGMHPGADIIDLEHNTTLAAAIYILDNLPEDRCEEAAHHLPLETETDTPTILDLNHKESSIRAMHHIIRHRNDDCTGKAHLAGRLPRTYMDAYTTAGIQQQDVPSRNRFLAILDLLPRHCIDDALREFERTYDDVMARMYRSYSVLREQKRALQSSQHQLNQSAKTLFSADVRDCDQIQNALRVAAASQSVDAITLPAIHNHRDHIQRLALYTHQCQLEQESSALSSKLHAVTVCLGRIHRYGRTERDELFSSEICRIWDSCIVTDPYAICFAFLYLLDQGSDLPWVYHVANTLLDIAGNELPWSRPRKITQSEVMELINQCDTVDGFTPYGTYFAGLAAPDAQRNNFAQLVYSATGCILPRYMSCGRTMEPFAVQFNTLSDFAHNTIAFLGAYSGRTKFPVAPAANKSERNIDVDELEQRIRTLELDKKALRQEAYDARREAAEMRAEYSSAFSAMTALHEELTDLRELVLREDQQEQPDTPETEIQFPWRTNLRIVVFGGHPSWLREIRDRLPDVRFVSHTQRPDPAMVRNADEIWFQTNALGHSLFHRVMDLAEGRNIPIRYFRHASAQKCAVQLATAQRE